MYIFTDLGTLPNGRSTRPRAINNNGQVVGSAMTPSGDIHAFLWKSGRMTDLGTLPGGEKYSQAYAINDSNHIVGISDIATLDWRHACLWIGGQPQDIGTPGEATVAFGINNSDHIVGGFGSLSGQVWPCIWRDGQRQKLPATTEKYNGRGRAFDINERDQVVGFEGDGIDSSHGSSAVAWEGMSSRTLHPQSAIRSEAIAINNRGQIACSAGDQNGVGKAFLCSLTNITPVDLGTLPRHAGSRARDINSGGDIVGYAFNRSSQGEFRRAFLWSFSRRRMLDLNEFIGPSSGWILTQAESINDHGQIVGRGQLQGQERGWLLDPLNIRVSDIPGYVVQIVFGLVAGGGGLVIDPRGGVVPIDPPNPIWQSLSPAVRDILVSLALNQVASQMNNDQTRREIQRAALNAVNIEVQHLLRALEKEGKH